MPLTLFEVDSVETDYRAIVWADSYNAAVTHALLNSHESAGNIRVRALAGDARKKYLSPAYPWTHAAAEKAACLEVIGLIGDIIGLMPTKTGAQ